MLHSLNFVTVKLSGLQHRLLTPIKLSQNLRFSQKSNSVTERRRTERGITERRITKRRLTERRITER
jgi:hypothetical protein